MTRRRLRVAVVAAGLVPVLAALSAPAVASVPKPTPLRGAAKVTVDPKLKTAKGSIEVVVRLTQPALAESLPENAIRDKALPSAASQRATTAAVTTQQASVSAAAKGLGATVRGTITKAINAVVYKVDASKVASLAAIPGVSSVNLMPKFETYAGSTTSGDLGQAATYLGADGPRAAGYDGTGVKVAVIDSGIDFTHFNLGGSGSTADYTTCYAQNAVAPSGICASWFGPAAPKVKGGMDFIGETWPNTPEAPDPNPIDFEGHGTHVSDIIGGKSADGTHTGMAPGISLYGLKVCSSISTSCSGLGILQAADWVLDPNGDSDLSDAMDIANLSLGSGYGQIQSDDAVAYSNVAALGVVVLAAAGNDGDQPFVVSSPSIGPNVISVAQTALPDEYIQPVKVNSPASVPGLPLGNKIQYGQPQPWAPNATSAITGNIAKPSGSSLGCTAGDFTGFPAGAIALIARGTCNGSVKAENAALAGASGVLIYNNRAGAPPTFGYGGGSTFVPTLTITQTEGGALAAYSGTINATIDPASKVSIAGTTVATSSRGPSNVGGTIKPEIGAPGAWLSAEVGTGIDNTSFGGTSGATPTVAGSAAILIQRYPTANTATIKSRLMGNAETVNGTVDALGNIYSTPITRIGGGEVRVDRAMASGIIARTPAGDTNALSFGTVDVGQTRYFAKQVTIRNNASTRRTFTLTPTFRDPADNTGAVTIVAPPKVTIPGNSSKQITVSAYVDATLLPAWALEGAAGIVGNDGSALNGPEYDGELMITSGSDSTHMPWQILPRKSSVLTIPANINLGAASSKALAVKNTGQAGDVSVFALTGTSPKFPAPAPGDPGTPGSNEAVIDLAATGVRDGGGYVEFAVSTYGRRYQPNYPAEFDIYVDTNRDGTDDYVVYNGAYGNVTGLGFAADGRNVTVVYNLSTGGSSIVTFTGADFNSSSVDLAVPASSLGLSAGQAFNFDVYAFDNYFTGTPTDAIFGSTYTMGMPKYALAEGTDLTIAAGTVGNLTVTKAGSPAASSESGLLLYYWNNMGSDAKVVNVG